MEYIPPNNNIVSTSLYNFYTNIMINIMHVYACIHVVVAVIILCKKLCMNLNKEYSQFNDDISVELINLHLNMTQITLKKTMEFSYYSYQ